MLLAMIARRHLIGYGLASAPWLSRARAEPPSFTTAIDALEARYGGRVGVAVFDSATGQQRLHRGDERFALCSTYKALAAACVLARIDRGADSLTRRITYSAADLVPYSPVTQHHTSLSVAEICAAAVTASDNTAGNLMFDSFGGPPGLTAFLRSVGDGITRSDRREPDLNRIAPGDLRDTTTPAAMLATLRSLLLGSALSPASRTQFADWLVACTTGDQRLRAGVPAGWRAGDKTGSSDDGATDDIAIVWPPQGKPKLIVAYYQGSPASAEARNAVLAEIGRLATT